MCRASWLISWLAEASLAVGNWRPVAHDRSREVLPLRRQLTAVFLLILFTCLSGCGYHSVSWDDSKYRDDGKTVNIQIFKNKSYKPNLEGVLANAVIDEFARRRGVKVESSDGDLTLSGDVTSYGYAAVGYSRSDVIKEYSASMSVSATLRKTSTQKVLWKGDLSWSQTFPANNNIALMQNAEDAAIQEICRHLAQQIYLRIVQDF